VLECLVSLIVVVIIALIFVYIIETVLAPFITLPPPIMTLIRLLIGLLVLIYALQCLGILGGHGFVFHRLDSP
jgi:type III secretory pathway component EscU